MMVIFLQLLLDIYWLIYYFMNGTVAPFEVVLREYIYLGQNIQFGKNVLTFET